MCLVLSTNRFITWGMSHVMNLFMEVPRLEIPPIHEQIHHVGDAPRDESVHGEGTALPSPPQSHEQIHHVRDDPRNWTKLCM